MHFKWHEEVFLKVHEEKNLKIQLSDTIINLTSSRTVALCCLVAGGFCVLHFVRFKNCMIQYTVIQPKTIATHDDMTCLVLYFVGVMMVCVTLVFAD